MSMRVDNYNSEYTIRNNTEVKSENKTDIEDSSLQNYAKSFEQRYNYFNKSVFINGISASFRVSDDFLKKCIENSDNAELLKKKLDEFPDYIASISEKYSGNAKKVNMKIDENGKISAEIVLSEENDKSKTDKSESKNDEKGEETSGKCTVAVNVEKRSRQIAAAKTAEQINAVLQMLEQDMSECKNGLSNGWCDEREIAKVEALMQRAKEKQAQMPAEDNKNDKDDINSELEFLLSSIL